jgi:hypothetical protein
VHRLAISAWPPLSGLMYQARVGGPPSSLLQETSVDVTSNADTRVARRRRDRDAFPKRSIDH